MLMFGLLTLERFLFVVAMAVIITLLLRLRSAGVRRAAQLLWLEAKIDALLSDSGITFKPYDSIPHMSIRYLQEGNQRKAIAALQALQKSFGVDKGAAQCLIDEIQRHASHHQQG